MEKVFYGASRNRRVFDYDPIGRLSGDGATVTAYAYDKSGNRVQNGSRLFTYDERNRLLTVDGYGYSYTPRGTLAQASGAAGTMTTSVDAFGQVVSQDYGGGTQTYAYGCGSLEGDGAGL